jgi:hypothetical protein
MSTEFWKVRITDSIDYEKIKKLRNLVVDCGFLKLERLFIDGLTLDDKQCGNLEKRNAFLIHEIAQNINPISLNGNIMNRIDQHLYRNKPFIFMERPAGAK